MAAYVPTAWLNNQSPPLSAANLNKLTAELRSQAVAKSISHSLPTWVDGATPALTDAAPLNEMERVSDLVAASLGLTYNPTSWSAGWTPARNAARFNYLEVAAAAARTAIDSGSITWQGSLTITSGGTYSGNYESTTTTPAVTVNTTQPVTITGRVRNLAGGALIDAEGAGAVNVTLDHLFAYGGVHPNSGRFFVCRNAAAVTITNCTIDKTRGIEITWGTGTVTIQRNRHTNIQGNDSTSGGDVAGNFIQLRETQSAIIDVSWNEILNEYNLSHPTDVISLFKTANAKVHDNYIQHVSKPGNAYNTSSQGTITLDQPDGIAPHPHDNEIYSNQMVDTINAVHIPAFAYNNSVHDNRLIQDGKLPDGVTQMGNGYAGWSILNGAGANNHMHNNVTGFVSRDAVRRDWYEELAAPEGRTAEIANNTTLADPITRQMELDEWTSWVAKKAGIAVGA